MNEPLRRAMFCAGHDAASLAEAAAVSVKSVERWLRGAAAPSPRTRLRVSALVGEDESYLWPEHADKAGLAGAEILAVYPRRTQVPKRLWWTCCAGPSAA